MQGLWQVPFDPDDPVNTPRDLNAANPLVVKAMQDALAYLDDEGRRAGRAVGRRCRWPATTARPPIPIGGGEGFAGNANAVSQPQAGGEPRPALPGQLRLLAHPGDRVPAATAGSRARTILTYSESMDPHEARSRSDQTRLFSQERWVSFPWTPRQVRRDAVRTYVVRGR